MNESQISVRYAKALFRSAAEKGLLDSVYEDMGVVEETYKLDDFRYMLLLPSLKPGQKARIAESVLRQYISGLSLSMINLVIKNKREKYLPGIVRNFMDFYRKEKGIRSVKLVTAQPVGEPVMKRIQDLIENAYELEVELSPAVNERIIGGFILTIEDRQYDASVSSSLKNIRKKMLQKGIDT